MMRNRVDESSCLDFMREGPLRGLGFEQRVGNILPQRRNFVTIIKAMVFFKNSVDAGDRIDNLSHFSNPGLFFNMLCLPILYRIYFTTIFIDTPQKALWLLLTTLAVSDSVEIITYLLTYSMVYHDPDSDYVKHFFIENQRWYIHTVESRSNVFSLRELLKFVVGLNFESDFQKRSQF